VSAFSPTAIEPIERALAGASLISPLALDQVVSVLLPQDFASVAYGAIYGAIRARLERGESLDLAEMTTAPDWPMSPVDTNELMNEHYSVSSIGAYADRIVEASRRRQIYRTLADLASQSEHDTRSADMLLADVASIPLDDAVGPRVETGPQVETLAEFIDRASQVDTETDWIAPGMIRRGWRIVVIGEEGVGKMVLLRQIAQHVAAGYDPLSTEKRITPRRVLIVDAENPTSTILHQVKLVSNRIDFAEECGDRLQILPTEYGIDLLSRVGRLTLERTLRKVKPDLMIAGPFYKLFRRPDPRADLESTTMQFLETIDDLRRRYGMAVMLEHHMPKAAPGRDRNSDPAGSSVLMRWPEIGLAIRRKKKSEAAAGGGERFDLARFRGSRENEHWPIELIQRDTQLSTAPAWSGRWGQRRLDEADV